MALPSTWGDRGMGFLSRTGIGVNLVPGDVAYGVDVQRTSDNGSGVAASTGATTIVEMPEGSLPEVGSIYFDLLPMDGAKRFYRARHTGKGYDEGSWTSWTTGHTPVLLGDQTLAAAKAPSAYPVKRDRKMGDGGYALAAANTTGNEFRGDLYLPSTAIIRVGSTGTAASKTRTLRIPHTEFVPVSTGTGFNFGNLGYLVGSTGLGSEFLVSVLVVPEGVTLTNFRTRAYLNALGNTFTGLLYSVDDNGAITLLATNSHSASTWSSVTTAISSTVGDNSFVVRVQLQPLSTVSDVRFSWMEFDYTRPDLDSII